MNRLTWLLGEIADRLAPLLALCGLLVSIGLLADAIGPLHIFWALCALALACIAMWAFWSE